jgi:hypothetical protein
MRFLLHSLVQSKQLDFALLLLRDYLARFVLPSASASHWDALTSQTTDSSWYQLQNLPLSTLLLHMEAVFYPYCSETTQTQDISVMLLATPCFAPLQLPLASANLREAATAQQLFEKTLCPTTPTRSEPVLTWRAFQFQTMLLHLFTLSFFKNALGAINFALDNTIRQNTSVSSDPNSNISSIWVNDSSSHLLDATVNKEMRFEPTVAQTGKSDEMGHPMVPFLFVLHDYILKYT